MRKAIVLLAAVLVAQLAYAGATCLYTLIRISEREVAITCANGEPSPSKTPGGMLVVTCPQ